MASWTTPKTFVGFDGLTAAELNTYLRDNTQYLKDAISGYEDPTAQSWTIINQNGATVSVDTTHQIVSIRDAQRGSSYDNVLYVTAAPAVRPWTVTMYLDPMFTSAPPAYGYTFGAYFRHSPSGYLHCLHYGLGGSATALAAVTKYTSPTAFSADYLTGGANLVTLPKWFRLGDDNTNRTIEISADGLTWIMAHSVARSDFLTADQVGFGLCLRNAWAATVECAVTLRHYEEA